MLFGPWRNEFPQAPATTASGTAMRLYEILGFFLPDRSGFRSVRITEQGDCLSVNRESASNAGIPEYCLIVKLYRYR